MTAAIVVERLTKRYGDLVALDEVSFDVPVGQLVAVLGPNGAGKTTTMEILEGFQAPTRGRVRCSVPSLGEEADRLADRVLVLSGGRILADTAPARLRAQRGRATIRYPLPEAAPVADLPATLAGHLQADRRALVVRSADVTATLGELVGWAERHHLDLAGLEVGPPSLEDAYLVLTGAPGTREPDRHG